MNTFLMLAALGVAGYVVYKLFNAVPKAATAISKALVPNPTASATIVLSDGTEIPYESVQWRSWIGWFNTLPQFDYNGIGYQLVSNTPDDTNTYYATIIASELTPSGTPPIVSPSAPGATSSWWNSFVQSNADTQGG